MTSIGVNRAMRYATLATLTAIAGSLFCLSGIAQTQTPAPFVGNWRVTWTGAKKQEEARLVLTESGGTWKASSQARHSPCTGLEVPVSVESSSADGLALTLKFSAVLSGCSDAKVTLQRDGEKTVTGKRGNAILTLNRE